MILASPLIALCALWSWACGTDVDLGGAGTSAECEPCASASDCASASAVCVLINGNGYCATPCPQGTGCGAGESCTASTTTAEAGVNACINASGCQAPPPPTGPDGAVIDRCGELVGPNVEAGCKACSYSCQANGCYGGYWCNTKYNDCDKPPTNCDAGPG